MQADDVEAFFAEQDVLMNLPDDGLQDHIARLVSMKSNSSNVPKAISQILHADLSTAGSSFSLQSLKQEAVESTSRAAKRKHPRSDIPPPSKRRNTSNVEGDADHPSDVCIALPDRVTSGSSERKILSSPPGDTTKTTLPLQGSNPSSGSAPDSGNTSNLISTDDISMFSEPSKMVPDVTGPALHVAIKPLSHNGLQNKTSKRGSKKALQYVQLQGTSAPDRVEASNVPSSPIEDPSGFASRVLTADKPAPCKRVAAPSSVPPQDVVERVSSHATSGKRDNPLKLDNKAGRRNVVAPATSSKVRTPSPAPSTASSCGSESTTAPKAPIPSKTIASKAKVPPAAVKPQPKNKDKKKSGPKPTPYEYALSLQENATVNGQASSKGKKKSQYLNGKILLYLGSDNLYASETTRGRMDYIVNHGGTLLPAYDPSRLTHIVTDAGKALTLRGLGLKSLDEVPEHIPIVKWGWVVAGLGRKRRSDRIGRNESDIEIDDVYQHAAFHSDIKVYAEAYRRFKRPKKEAPSKEEGSSREQVGADKRDQNYTDRDESKFGVQAGIQALEYTQSAKPRRSSQPPSSLPQDPDGTLPHVDDANDPLSEFYALAKAEREYQKGLLASSGDEGDDESDPGSEVEIPKAPRPSIKRGFACDSKEPQQAVSPNQDIVDKLQELMELHKAKPGEEDKWRAFSYGKCLRALRNYPTRIKSFSEARSIRGVGEKTARKIMEILQTGNLKRIEYERTDDVEVTRLFQGVYGVGQNTAYKWYANGCRTLQDLRMGKGGVKLSTAQEIGLKFYDDINSRMPRNEAKAIFDLIKPIALSIDPDLFIEIMGSYRRGKATCGDIDILITRDPSDGKSHAGILPLLLSKLHGAGIITEDLALPEDNDDFEAIYRGLCRLPGPDSRRRRIDFLTVPWTSRGAALLYYTGDDIFNRAMRYKAGVMGYSLNQRGLYSGVVRDPRDRRVKTTNGTLVASETEGEIFRILGVPWQEPHERVRG